MLYNFKTTDPNFLTVHMILLQECCLDRLKTYILGFCFSNFASLFEEIEKHQTFSQPLFVPNQMM